MKQIDMSSEAVTRRLRQASELRDLCLSLMKAKKVQEKKLRNSEKDTHTQDERSCTFDPSSE
jgi:hypothetical protein